MQHIFLRNYRRPLHTEFYCIARHSRVNGELRAMRLPGEPFCTRQLVESFKVGLRVFPPLIFTNIEVLKIFLINYELCAIVIS